MTMARKRDRKKKSGTVNFKGVETFTKMDDGEQLLTITDESSEEEGDAGPYIKIVATNEDDAKVWHNVSFSEKSLWNAKAFLEACGVEAPEEDTPIADILEELNEKTFMATIEHETFEGKKKPRIVDFWPADGKSSSKKDEAPDFDDMDEDELKKFIKKNKLDVDPDDFPKEKKLRAAVVEAYEAEAGDSGSDAIDVSEMDEDELKKLIKKEKLDIDPDDFPKLKKLRAAVEEALEGAGGDSNEEEWTKKNKPDEDAVKEMDQDGLQAVIDGCKLRVDLDNYKTLRKMQAAVIEALE